MPRRRLRIKRDIVAYLFLWSKPTEVPIPGVTLVELQDNQTTRGPRCPPRGRVASDKAASTATPASATRSHAMCRSRITKPAASGKDRAALTLDDPTRKAMTAYLGVAAAEKHHRPSPDNRN